MKQISFPGLGLNFEIDRIAIHIFGIDIYWYAIFIVLGFVLAILFCKKDNKKYNIQFENIFEIFIIMIPVAILSARLYFVLFKLDYYLQNPIEILNIRNGGLAIYGGIIGAIITICIYCKKKKLKILDVLDYMAPYLALGQAIGRWGNFFNGEAYGTETNNLFRMGIVEQGKYIEVHPTFFYEFLGTISIFAILYILRNKRKYSGQITYLYLTLYGIVRFFVEGLRTDSLMLGNIRISQLLSLALFIVFGGILIYNYVKNYVKGIKGKRKNE